MKLPEIVLIHKNSITAEPPAQTVLQVVSDLGYPVHLITFSVNDYWKEILKSRNIRYDVLKMEGFLHRKTRNPFRKIYVWLRYRQAVLKILRHKGPDTLVWFVDATSFVPLLFSRVAKKHPYVLHILETYDQFGFYKFAIRKMVRDCKQLVVCEENRAAIFNVWFHPEKYPFVLPNKPYRLTEVAGARQYIKEHVPELDALLEKGTKIILYQGILSAERDLSLFIRAIQELEGDYKLVLMGKDLGMLEKYRQSGFDFLYIPAIPSPQHLYVTSVAHIGILVYDPVSLNQIYCAPNKIFEYGGYGVPMIGNNIPGLARIFEHYGTGEICGIKSVESIQTAIRKIEERWESYRENCLKMCEKVNVAAVIQEILK